MITLVKAMTVVDLGNPRVGTMKAGYSERDYQRRPVGGIFPPTFRGVT